VTSQRRQHLVSGYFVFRVCLFLTPVRFNCFPSAVTRNWAVRIAIPVPVTVAQFQFLPFKPERRIIGSQNAEALKIQL